MRDERNLFLVLSGRRTSERPTALRPKPYRTDSALQRGQFGKPPQIEINSAYTLDSQITVVQQDECTRGVERWVRFVSLVPFVVRSSSPRIGRGVP